MSRGSLRSQRGIPAAIRANASGVPGIVMALVALACSELASPVRATPYEWRLIVPYDSAGPRVDSLSFHWPRASVPVRIWVEADANQLPDRVREGIARWRGAFLYGEWDARLVSDSSTADVLFRTIQAPTPAAGTLRFAAQALSCEGATDVDTVSTRFQLRLPIRAYVYPVVLGAPDLLECMRIVAAHELGHTMGLFQHSPDPLDLMYAVPAAQGLTDRDVSTALDAYHFPADMVPVRP